MTGAAAAGDGRNLCLIAARAPVAGETKTRLGATIGMARAAALYRAFLTDLAVRFGRHCLATAGYDLGWAYTPAGFDFAALLAELGSPDGLTPHLVPQVGDGWGVRQANLLRWGHDHGYARTVLIASDSPHLPCSVVPAAFAALADHDVALGRVLDGGYYLIGLAGDHDVLTGVPMSSADAASALAARATGLGLRLAELPPTFDVDEAADLDRLRHELAPDGAAAPATWRALHALGLAAPPFRGEPWERAHQPAPKTAAPSSGEDGAMG